MREDKREHFGTPNFFCRVCIRPEVSRTKTVGKKGVSIGTYFTQHLQHIVLNTNPVDFTKKNLTYLIKVLNHCKTGGLGPDQAHFPMDHGPGRICTIWKI